MIVFIHGQDIVEGFKVISINRTRTQITQIDAALQGGTLGTAIRWLSDMIGMGPGGIDVAELTSEKRHER